MVSHGTRTSSVQDFPGTFLTGYIADLSSSEKIHPSTASVLSCALFLANARSAESEFCSTFYVGDAASVGSQYSHHGNITALCYDLLKPRYAQGPAYSINYGANMSDFEPIFNALIRKNIIDAFDERWPEEFVPTLNQLVRDANEQRDINETAAAELYLRANALGHIAHYPSLHTKLRHSSYEIQISAFLNATAC